MPYFRCTFFFYVWASITCGGLSSICKVKAVKAHTGDMGDIIWLMIGRDLTLVMTTCLTGRSNNNTSSLLQCLYTTTTIRYTMLYTGTLLVRLDYLQEQTHIETSTD
ncbi:unnamed protein product [Meganyctiphanes norvegica]|uniref:Secreted protein n=1 Tax=Meganyctiphanes norvegica TaxID=48144 RepID=A0AAV2PW77_MEGNR